MLVCLGLLQLAGNFNEPGNPWRAAFDSTGLRWRDWDQRVNYQRNGFVSGLLFNMHVNAMAEPKGYIARPRWTRSRRSTPPRPPR